MGRWRYKRTARGRGRPWACRLRCGAAAPDARRPGHHGPRQPAATAASTVTVTILIVLSGCVLCCIMIHWLQRLPCPCACQARALPLVCCRSCRTYTGDSPNYDLFRSTDKLKCLLFNFPLKNS